MDDAEGLRASLKALMRAHTITEPIERREVEAARYIDPVGADYIIALDDSGGVEPLLNRCGNFHLTKKPMVVLCAYGVQSNLVESFNGEWNELRTHIKRKLRADFLPPIHMRVMYGKSLASHIRGHPNPYIEADFHDQILKWIFYAKFLMRDYSFYEGHHIDQMYLGHREAFHSAFCQLMTRTKLWKDLRYLKRTRPSYYEFALSRLSSPLPKVLALQLGLLNEILKESRKSAVVVFDSFDASKGVTERTVQEVVSRLGFTQIRQLQRVENSDQIPLVQAADVFAWHVNRTSLMMQNKMEHDPNILPVMFDSVSTAAWTANHNWDQHQFVRSIHQQLILQYAIFRESVLATKKVRALAPLLVSNEEFEARIAANAGKRRTRVTMFVDETLSERD